MKSLRFLVAAVPLIFLTQSGHIGAQTDPRPPGAVYLKAARQLNVTMSRNGTVVGAATFPSGTHVSARAIGQQPRMAAPGRFEFHGNVELRALPLADIPAGSEGRPAADLLSTAPVFFATQGVDVVIENVSE